MSFEMADVDERDSLLVAKVEKRFSTFALSHAGHRTRSPPFTNSSKAFEQA
jgi:hypothetical protein